MPMRADVAELVRIYRQLDPQAAALLRAMAVSMLPEELERLQQQLRGTTA